MTLCDARSPGLPELVRAADLVVAAVRVPRFVQGGWIKPGAVVVDAGSHPGPIGDVDLATAALHACAYTPVPGGGRPHDSVHTLGSDRRGCRASGRVALSSSPRGEPGRTVQDLLLRSNAADEDEMHRVHITEVQGRDLLYKIRPDVGVTWHLSMRVPWIRARKERIRLWNGELNMFRHFPHWGTLNYYIGCEFGCQYCYATSVYGLMHGRRSRRLHFARDIFVATNAPESVAAQLDRMSGVEGKGIIQLGEAEDAYQPVEERHGITRRLLGFFLDKKIPVVIITKSSLILRDLDLLTKLAEHDLVHVDISLCLMDEELRSRLEPRAASVGDRVQVLKRLQQSGVPAGILAYPVIPGISEHSLPGIIQVASDCSARYVMMGDLFVGRRQLAGIRRSAASISARYRADDAAFTFCGGTASVAHDRLRRITELARDLGARHGVKVASKYFYDLHDADFAGGAFNHRYPLIFDYVDLLKAHAGTPVSLEQAVRVAKAFQHDGNYLKQLEYYWKGGKMFRRDSGLDITVLRGRGGRTSYLLRSA